MKTVIEQLFKDIETFGYKTVLSKKQHYLDKEKELIKSSWKTGNNHGRMGTFTNENEFYNNLISEENEM